MRRSGLVKSLAELVRAWWRADRIRAAASEGEWFRVTVGAIVEKDGEMFEVVERYVGGTDSEPLVAYRCVAGGCSVQLLVTPGADSRRPRLEWHDALGSMPVEPVQLTLWPRSRVNSDPPNPAAILV